MKTRLMATALCAIVAGSAHAETIGVSMQSFNDNFQTLLRNGLQNRASEAGVEIQVEDSERDVAKQLNQVNNFIASGVDAIIVTLADTAAAPGITAAAESAGVPLVYLNLAPENLDDLPASEAYVGSNEVEAGTLGATEGCRLLADSDKAEGASGYVLIGDLAHNAAQQRTQAVHDVLEREECSFISITDEQQARWLRTESLDLVTNWITAGEPIDVIFANNDEMALGATQALKSAGIAMDDVVVVGIDATLDGLEAMKMGDLDVTVFQNAGGQAAAAVDAALKLAKGEAVVQVVSIPFELVTPDNLEDYLGKN